MSADELKALHKRFDTLEARLDAFVDGRKSGGPDIRALEKLVIRCARFLLSEKESVLQRVVDMLQEGGAADRVILYENEFDPLEGTCFIARYRSATLLEVEDTFTSAICTADSFIRTSPLEKNTDAPACRPYRAGFQRWKEHMFAGKSITGLTADFPDCEKEVLAAEGVVSVLALPLVINAEWRGMLRFDSFQAERFWHVDEQELLQTVADMVSMHYRNREMFTKMEEERIRFASLFRSSPAMMCLSTLADGIFLDINEAMHKGLGYSRDELIGRRSSVSGMLSAEERARYHSLILEQGGLLNEPMILKKRDGKPLYGLVSAEVTIFEGIECLLTVIVDVTQQREDQQRLMMLQQALEQSPAAIILANKSGRIEYANKAYSQITGEAPANAVGTQLSFFSDKDRTDDELSQIRDALQKNNIWRGEVRSRRKDGTSFWERAVLAPMHNSAGVLTHYIGVREDITEQKEADRHVRESEALFRAIFEGINAAILMIEPHSGVIVDANQKAEELCGYNRSECIGMSSQTLYPEDSSASCTPIEEQMRNLECTMLRKDGTSRTVLKTVLPIRKGGKELWVEILIDITERKSLERQLSIAQKLESIGQLAAGIAHELNTPIQYVSDSVRFLGDAYADILLTLDAWRAAACFLEEAGGDTVEGYAQAMQDARNKSDAVDFPFLEEETPKAIAQSLSGLDRMGHIVRAMKRFAHPGDDGELREADINTAISDTVTVAKNEWKYVADVDLKMDPALPLVCCRPADFNQVLLNIVVNAAQAIEEKVDGTGEKGTITIRTRKEKKSVVIEIEDTGAGIARDKLDRVFDPFFTTKPVGKGTGQGLAIAHDIVVAKHSGTLSVDSIAGKGTTFTITLPLSVKDGGSSVCVTEQHDEAENTVR